MGSEFSTARGVTARKFFLQHAHGESFHAQAVGTMMQVFRLGVWWPEVWGDCSKFVRTCVDCVEYYGTPEKTALRKNESALHFRDRYIMDFQGPFKLTKRGNLYLFTMVDSATGFFWGQATKTKDARVVCSLLYRFFLEFGPPLILRADNGFGHAENSVLRKFLRAKFPTTTLRLGTAYNPKSQQAIERVHPFSRRYFSFRKSYQWDELVLEFQYYLRKMPCAARGNLSPLELLLHEPMEIEPGKTEEVLRNFDKAVRRRRERQLLTREKRKFTTEYRSKLLAKQHGHTVQTLPRGQLVFVQLPEEERKSKSKLAGNCRPELYAIKEVYSRSYQLVNRDRETKLKIKNPVSMERIVDTKVHIDDYSMPKHRFQEGGRRGLIWNINTYWSTRQAQAYWEDDKAEFEVDDYREFMKNKVFVEL